jgi:hypothetical protein
MTISRLAAGAAVLAAGAATVVPAFDRVTSPAGTPPASRVAQFDHPRENPYFPLRPGTRLRYRGSEDGERFRETVTVTTRTKTILGVRTTVVRDVLRRADGTLAERTRDWYAADDDGNVWYFGEATATYDEHGHLESREGSWQAGVHGAVPGTIMPADPRPTDAYRQELLRGHAEDQAWIVQRAATVRVPYGRLRHVVRSFEWSRLEPRVMSEKLYAPGLGIVKEQDLAGGNERFVLVSVRRP